MIVCTVSAVVTDRLVAQQLEEPAGVLTIKDAIILSLQRNPELAAAALEVRAREARMLQARALPNPEVAGVVENLGGEIAATGGTQTTLQLGQLVELGGKRSARFQVATAARDLAQWEFEVRRIDLLSRVTRGFLDVLAAQQRVELADEAVRLSEEVARTVSERVNAGKVSPIEETRAGVALAAERIELDRARADLTGARTRLAATWGSSEPKFERVAGDLNTTPAVPPFESLLAAVERNPDLARWSSEIAEREAILRLERARGVPDVTVGGGYRSFELGSNAFLASASVPIPLFDRNRGAQQEARQRLARVQEERRAAEVRVRQALAETYATFVRAESEVRNVREHVVPGAESVFAAVSEGYRLGKFGLLDVLDARRTLATARAQLVRALADLHRAFAELERITGAPIQEIPMGANNDRQ